MTVKNTETEGSRNRTSSDHLHGPPLRRLLVSGDSWKWTLTGTRGHRFRPQVRHEEWASLRLEVGQKTEYTHIHTGTTPICNERVF